MREAPELRLTTDARYLLMRIHDHYGQAPASSPIAKHENELLEDGYVELHEQTLHITTTGRAAAGLIRRHYDRLRELNEQ
ncbi:hypothetical protein [Saccharopolyspora griseoalba]|uniref:Uncharacterized protein n=1 Tax=Saccharopolyspora griseoalba TaxID=1431848 RepID=A0ABW2LTK3_9PSEU